MEWDFPTSVRRGTLGLALVLALLACWASATGSILMWLFAIGAAYIGMGSLVFEAIAFFWKDEGRLPYTWRKLIWIAIPVLLALATTNMPLQVAFRLSKPDFKRLLDEHRAGRGPDLPRRVGIYTVRRIDDHEEGVRLVIDEGGGNPHGFCYYRSGVQSGFNPWDVVALGDGWFLVQED